MIKWSNAQGKFDAAVIHIGINDILNDTSGAGNQMINMLKIPAKCQSQGITKLFVSNLFSIRKFLKDIIRKPNFRIFDIFGENQLYYIEKR